MKISVILAAVVMLMGMGRIRAEQRIQMIPELNVKKVVKVAKTDFDLENTLMSSTFLGGKQIFLSPWTFGTTDAGDRLTIIDLEGLEEDATEIPDSKITQTDLDTFVTGASAGASGIVVLSQNLAVLFGYDSTEKTQKILEVQDDMTLEEKTLDPAFEIDHNFNDEYYFTTHRKGTTAGVLLDDALILIDTLDDFSTKTFYRDAVTSLEGFDFDYREDRSWAYMGNSGELYIYDISLASPDSTGFEVMKMDTDSYPLSLKANSLNSSRLLTSFEDPDDYLHIYYNVQDASPSELPIIATSGEIRSSGSAEDSRSMSVLAILGTNYFFSILTDDYDSNLHTHLNFVDTSVVPAEVDTDVPKVIDFYDITSSTLAVTFPDLEYATVNFISRFEEGQNKFVFHFIHGTDYDEQSESAIAIIELDVEAQEQGQECHPDCLSCLESGVVDRCTDCKEGWKLSPAPGSTTDNKFGVCKEIGEYKFELERVSIAVCNGEEILGCIKCSRQYNSKCEACQYYLGLGEMTSDTKAGSICVKCPLENCRSCDLKEGEEDSERKCHECAEGFTLTRTDGELVCTGAFLLTTWLKVLCLAFILIIN